MTDVVRNIVGQREADVPCGRWKTEAKRIVERIPGQGIEPPVPHQGGIEGGVHGERCSPLVSGPAAVGAYDIVVLNADGHRLRVAESIRGRVASAARVVAM